jgi:hypothetical protein
MKSGNPNAEIYEAQTARTLDQNGGNPSCTGHPENPKDFWGGSQGGLAVVEPQIARAPAARGDSSPCADRGQNIIAFSQNQRCEIRDLNGIAACLAAEPGMKQQTYIAQPEPRCLTPWDKQQTRIFTPDGPAPALVGADGGGGRRPGGLILSETHPAIAGTLCGSGAGTSRPAGNANETDLAIAYCLQGSMTPTPPSKLGGDPGGRDYKNGPQGKGVNEEKAFSLTSADRHAVAAVDCRNISENGETCGTLASKCTGGYSLNYQNPIRTGCVIRRLTPTECERLMSFDDGWTEFGYDGKPISDSKRYSLLGNSIVVNVIAYIMKNIADVLRERG